MGAPEGVGGRGRRPSGLRRRRRAAAAAGASAGSPPETPPPGPPEAGVGPDGPWGCFRSGGDAAAARGESLVTLGPKVRMDGGHWRRVAGDYVARAPKMGPRSRGGPGDSARPGSIRTLWF